MIINKLIATVNEGVADLHRPLLVAKSVGVERLEYSAPIQI